MQHTVTIEKIITDGRGLARPESGKVVMVSGVLPGEVVKISKGKEHRGYIEAEPVKIITPSDARMQPVCPWYKYCGGCDLQHCDYELQLQIKKGIVRETLDRAGVVCPDNCLASTLPSPKHLAYRYRLRMKVDRNGKVGFHRNKSNTVVPVTNCAVATGKINTAISFLQSEVLLKNFEGICKEIELLHSPADDALTLLLQIENKKKADQNVLAVFKDCQPINQVTYKTGLRLYSATPLQPLKQGFTLSAEPPSRYSLFWEPGCFSQVNASQNEQLVQLICGLVGDVHDTSILDLYCGTGNFSIPLAMLGAAVTGIELSSAAIKWAKINAESAAVTCNFYAADVHKSLQHLIRTGQKVDTIILDPPRRGIGKATSLLPSLKPENIIYVSCDPATLARDVATISTQGYSLRKLIPVDMFPQTHHIESVALLEKN